MKHVWVNVSQHDTTRFTTRFIQNV